jgi:hypothetical protein
MRSPCCLSPPNIARQQLGKYVIETMNTLAIIKELSDVVFSMQSVSIIHYVVKGK